MCLSRSCCDVDFGICTASFSVIVLTRSWYVNTSRSLLNFVRSKCTSCSGARYRIDEAETRSCLNFTARFVIIISEVMGYSVMYGHAIFARLQLTSSFSFGLTSGELLLLLREDNLRFTFFRCVKLSVNVPVFICVRSVCVGVLNVTLKRSYVQITCDGFKSVCRTPFL